jgi:hypothetical protein
VSYISILADSIRLFPYVTMNQQALLDDDQAVLGCLINIVSFSLDS